MDSVLILEIANKLNYPTPLPIAKEIVEFSRGNRKIIEKILKRINNDEPWEYIRGYTYFLNNKFFLNKHTLIPRIETEYLVEISIEEIEKNKEKDLQIIDIGTGSGCIGISLEKRIREKNENLKNFKIICTDINKAAIKIAKKNSKLNNCKNISFFNANLLDFKFSYDIPTVIIANLPYIPSEKIENLENSVLKHEPLLALDGGKDGIEYYEKLLKQIEEINMKFCIFEIDEMNIKGFEKKLSKYKTKYIKDQFDRYRFLLIHLV